MINFIKNLFSTQKIEDVKISENERIQKKIR